MKAKKVIIKSAKRTPVKKKAKVVVKKAALKNSGDDEARMRSWTTRHKALWKKLVGKNGQTTSVQGELIRITGQLCDEAHRNGNANWGKSFEVDCDFLERYLLDKSITKQFTAAKVRWALKGARSWRRPDTSGHGGPLYLLSELAVAWCDSHPAS